MICNLCGIEFDNNDKLIKIRKEKHEEWHKVSTYLGSGSPNTACPQVVWK